MKEQKQQPLKIEKFIELIKKYKEPTEITEEMKHDLIDRIMIHESTGKKPHKEMVVDIYYNFIGQFEVAYTPEEQEEIRIREEKEAQEKAERKKERQRANSRKHSEKVKAARWAANDGHKYPKRICSECGKEFWPKGNKQTYCSKECQYSHYQKVIHEKRYVEKGNHTFRQKNCALCGKPFWPVNGQEVLCSPECKAENRRRKQNEYYHRKISPVTKRQLAITEAKRTDVS